MALRSLSQTAVVIPTYQRPGPLADLLGDLSNQSLKPTWIVIVDGSPNSSSFDRTAERAKGAGKEFRWVASNHANLPYQRWLGREACPESNFTVYLDDDIRLLDQRSLEELVVPLLDPAVAAVTAEIELGNQQASKTPIRGVTRNLPAGTLAPNGERVPIPPSGQPLEPVEWLRGGAMAVRTAHLTPDCFPKDLFALAERGWGLGEDTILARHLAARGRLVLTRNARVVHPGSSDPTAYRHDPANRGYASAYSRRLINDYYRAPALPSLRERLALWRSLCSSAALHLVRRPRFGLGFLHGAIDAALRPPSAARLCPGTSWDSDARLALSSLRQLP